MLAEAVAAGATSPTRQHDALPVLAPVFVVREDHVEALLRSRRAEVAQLSLLLRSTLHDAEVAESEGQRGHLTALHELAVAGLEQRIGARRSELAAQLEDEKRAAAALIRGAQRQATALMVDANRTTVTAVLDGLPLPPSLVEPTLAMPLVPSELAAIRQSGIEDAARERAAQADLPREADSPSSTVIGGANGLVRYLYLDVVLPVVGVLVVLVSLLLWVG